MIYFVTEDYLKTETPISKNVDVQDVISLVKPMCETRLIPILGRYFFNDLLVKYNNQTLNANEIELVQHVKSCVAWRVAAMAVYTVSRPLKNIGLQQLDTENSSPVNLEELTFGIDQYNSIASSYQTNLAEYIVENRGLFPVFMSDLNKGAKLRDGIDPDLMGSGFEESIMFI